MLSLVWPLITGKGFCTDRYLKSTRNCELAIPRYACRENYGKLTVVQGSALSERYHTTDVSTLCGKQTFSVKASNKYFFIRNVVAIPCGLNYTYTRFSIVAYFQRPHIVETMLHQRLCNVMTFTSNTPARVVPLYVSSRALSKVFEHRNFIARYQR